MLPVLVRAVRHYQQLSFGSRLLFVLTGQGKKGISRDAIKFLLRAVIRWAYNSATEEDCRAVKVKVHKVLNITPLMLFKKKFYNQEFPG